MLNSGPFQVLQEATYASLTADSCVVDNVSTQYKEPSNTTNSGKAVEVIQHLLAVLAEDRIIDTHYLLVVIMSKLRTHLYYERYCKLIVVKL